VNIGNTIKADREDSLGIVTLNRPDRLNAMNAEMIRALPAAMLDLIDDHSIRAILINAAGRGFCAGTDIQESANGLGEDAVDRQSSGGEALRRHINPMLLRMRAAPKPIVVAVNGAAAGVGCSLALAGDIVLAGRSSSFIAAFVRVGAVPDAGMTWFLPRIVGEKRAAAMMLLGEAITADNAFAWGMVDKILADAEIDAGSRGVAHQLAAGPTSAYAAIKNALAKSQNNQLDEQLDLEANAQEIAFKSADLKEGFAAFIERRQPVFRGF
jgi:2-(1,2-epoxy-1,2-dihydrophenyl)acetyl-CoA isomerase